MPMDDETRQRVEKFLNEKVPRPGSCQLCHNTGWVIGSNVWQLLEFTGAGLTFGGPIYPVIPLTCNTCGNTLFLNAIFVGAVEPPKKEAADEHKK